MSFYGKFASADNRCLLVGNVLTSFAPDGVAEYIIPDGVTAIDKYAFSDCKLISITIPDSVISIGEDALHLIDAIIYCKAEIPPALANNELWDWSSAIYVPRNSAKAYKSAHGWNEANSNIVGYDF